MQQAAPVHRETPELIGIEQVSEGWINTYILKYRLPDGRSFEYEAASRKKLESFCATLAYNAEGKAVSPDAVCIVPVLADGSVLLIREFRYPLNAWCIAFPAGLLEPGESIAACVARELAEETGYVLAEDADASLRPLPQSGYSSTGLTDESVQVVFADVRPAGKSRPEPNEFIQPFILAADDIRNFLRTNTDCIGTRAQLILELLSWKPTSR